jgi:GTP cyclohydrolase II
MTQPASDAVPAPTPSVRTTIRLPVLLADGRESLALLHSFNGLADGKEHVALEFGQPTNTPLVRLHSECMTGDVLGSARCDCGPQLQESLRLLHQEGGYLLYLRQEGRGIGLYRKLDAYRLQDLGHDTFAANRLLGHCDDERDYTAAAQMLTALGVAHVTLITNNPDKRSQLERLGIAVASVRETGVYGNRHNLDYLQTKIRHAGHVMALRDKDEE